MTILDRVALFLRTRRPFVKQSGQVDEKLISEYPGKPRHVRMRGTLPPGYQFGDAQPLCPCVNPFCPGRHHVEPPPSLEGATVMIDGVEHVLGPCYEPAHQHAFEHYNILTNRSHCRCGASVSPLDRQLIGLDLHAGEQ